MLFPIPDGNLSEPCQILTQRWSPRFLPSNGTRAYVTVPVKGAQQEWDFWGLDMWHGFYMLCLKSMRLQSP